MILNISNKKETIYLCVIATLLFLTGFLYAYDNGMPVSSSSNKDLADREGGEFLRFVYVGTSTCAFCDKDTHEHVKELKRYFQNFARHYGYKFISTGISTDENSVTGINFLIESGYYDEIISGGSWYSLGAHHYIWDVFQSRASTPQIVLTTTHFHVIPADNEIANIERKERFLKRLSGDYEIETFYQLVINSDFGEIRSQLGWP